MRLMLLQTHHAAFALPRWCKYGCNRCQNLPASPCWLPVSGTRDVICKHASCRGLWWNLISSNSTSAAVADTGIARPAAVAERCCGVYPSVVVILGCACAACCDAWQREHLNQSDVEAEAVNSILCLPGCCTRITRGPGSVVLKFPAVQFEVDAPSSAVLTSTAYSY
jgi:hypothetical protein